MGLKKVFDLLKEKVSHEVKAVQGEEGKNKLFMAEHEYTDLDSAKQALAEAKLRLFDVNGWSEMSGINSTFTLYEENGEQAEATSVRLGQFIKIELPASGIENWVSVTALNNKPDFAEFVVRPTEKPVPKNKDEEEEVKHFFTDEASSTFRVEREGNTIKAYEIGLNEVINNDGDEAGDRAVLNTLIAGGGWAFFQKLQWDKLTNYLVGNSDT